MLRAPVLDAARSARIWTAHVLPLKGAYTMRA
jgi:hypothetical protein